MFYPVRRVRILGGSRNNTFGWVRKKGTKVHQGWDFQATDGSELFAVASGKIVAVNSDPFLKSDYGCSILLKFTGAYGEDLYAFYAHISPHVLVSKNETVREGQLIGYSGSTGNASGSVGAAQHLHFEFRDRRWCGFGLQGRIDPAFFYGDPPYGWIDGGSIATDVTGSWYETPEPAAYSAY